MYVHCTECTSVGVRAFVSERWYGARENQGKILSMLTYFREKIMGDGKGNRPLLRHVHNECTEMISIYVALCMRAKSTIEKKTIYWKNRARSVEKEKWNERE